MIAYGRTMVSRWSHDSSRLPNVLLFMHPHRENQLYYETMLETLRKFPGQILLRRLQICIVKLATQMRGAQTAGPIASTSWQGEPFLNQGESLLVPLFALLCPMPHISGPKPLPSRLFWPPREISFRCGFSYQFVQKRYWECDG
jgi:hypothetical protein